MNITNGLKKFLDIDFKEPSHKEIYEANLTLITQRAKTHDFFKNLKDFLAKYKEKYKDEKGVELFMSQPSDRINLFQIQPEIGLFTKPYESAVDKSFRYNILENNPTRELKEPVGGWLTPKNWFQILPDTARTMIVCKYKDGPELIAEQLKKHAADCGLASESGSREKDDGYYAFHFYVIIPCKIIKDKEYENNSSKSGKFADTDIKIEMQITTQLQEALNQISHLQYEHSRLSIPSKIRKSWKWDFKSPRFKTAYLSHTLHLLEAIILDTRNQSIDSEKIDS